MKLKSLSFPPIRAAEVRESLRRFERDERGLSTVEYVILLAVIVVGAVLTWNKIGSKFKETLSNANDQFQQIGSE